MQFPSCVLGPDFGLCSFYFQIRGTRTGPPLQTLYRATPELRHLYARVARVYNFALDQIRSPPLRTASCIFHMELQLKKKSQGWCDFCAQISLDFLETILGAGEKELKLTFSIFRVDVASDIVDKCPLCYLLRECISPRLLDPQCMDFRLCLKVSDLYLVSIEYPRSALFGTHRGDLALLSELGRLAP